MTVFRNINNEEFIALTELSFSHKVNGEKSLKGTIYTNDKVISGIDRGWSLTFEDELYYITYALPVDNGESVTVEFDAIHEFFYKMGKSSVYTILDGSNTAKKYLDLIFNGSGYNYQLGVALAAFEKQNFGMKNRLSLFNDFINSTDTEFKIVGKTVTIQEKVGSDLSTIVRKGFNLQELGLEHNIGDFVTYARGFGAFYDSENQSKGRLSVEYISPLMSIYGKLEADPIVDERFTDSISLYNKVKSVVESSYSISVTLTVEDLQKAGYKYSPPLPGDYILAINEELDFQQKIRIVGIDESFDVQGNSLSKSVTCSSINTIDQKNITDATNSKTWSDIGNGLKPIPNDWLTDSVQNATNALLEAQTELKFTTNGILAIEKGNSNRLVILNSAGIGVSTDGGKTFENAMTAEGVNASVINSGILKAINIIGVAISGSTFETTGNNGKIFMSGGNMKFQDYTGQEFGSFYPANAGDSDVTMMMDSKGNINFTAGDGKVKYTTLQMTGGYASDYRVTMLNGEQTPLGFHYTENRLLKSGVEIDKDGVLIRGVTNAYEGLEISKKLIVYNNAPINFYSSLNMNGYAIQNQSDIRLKENIEDSTIDAIQETKKLNFVEFDRKQNYQSKDPKKQPSRQRELGLIAQYSPFLSVKGKEDNYLRIDMNKQIMLNSMTNKQLILLIEEQDKRIKYIETVLSIGSEKND